jgi:hypothetical protein
MDYSTVAGIRRKLDGSEWGLLDAAWKARQSLLEILDARPVGLSASARRRYQWFVSFVQGLFVHIIWHLRTSDGYRRLTDVERETLEAEVFHVPLRQDEIGSDDLPSDRLENAEFVREAGRVLALLTADQRHYLFRAWHMARQLTAAVNTPLDQLREDERIGHEQCIRDLSHHHVQMRNVLCSLARGLKLSPGNRRRIASLVAVRFDERDGT